MVKAEVPDGETLQALNRKISRAYLFSLVALLFAMWVVLTRKEAQEPSVLPGEPSEPQVLTVSGLRVVDESGQLRVSIDADPDGGSEISLRGSDDYTHATIKVSKAGESHLMLGSWAEGGRVLLSASPGAEGGSSLSMMRPDSPIAGVFAGTSRTDAVLSVRGLYARSKFEVRQDGRDMRADLLGQDDSVLWSTRADPD